MGYKRGKTGEELKKPKPEKKKEREDKRKKKKLARLERRKYGWPETSLKIVVSALYYLRFLNSFISSTSVT